MRAFSKIMWSLGLSLLVLSTPLAASAQIPSGCHPITDVERAALLLREAPVPTTGFFCDADLPLLFGSCTNDPLPILLAKYTPGSQSSREGNRGITRLNAEFACRLSRYLTAFPATTIVSAYRSTETQKILWEEALRKYGSEAEARKWVAPPGSSRHNTGIAADLSNVTEAARTAAPNFGLIYRLGNEPWHIEGADITTPVGEFSSGTGGASPYTTYFTPLQTSYTNTYSQLLAIALALSNLIPTDQPITTNPFGYFTPRTVSTTTLAYLDQRYASSTIAQQLLLLLNDSNLIFATSTATSTGTTATTTNVTATSTTEEDELKRSLLMQIISLLTYLIGLLETR